MPIDKLLYVGTTCLYYEKYLNTIVIVRNNKISQQIEAFRISELKDYG